MCCGTEHYPRYILPALRADLDDSPVVLIHGARQTGKTTLAQSLGEEYGYINFDDPALVDLAYADPSSFVIPDLLPPCSASMQ